MSFQINDYHNKIVLLHVAVEHCSIQIVHHLLCNYRSSNYINSFNKQNKTALGVACESGDLKLVKLLLEYGAYPNKHKLGMPSPLMTATVSNNVPVITILLESKADPLDIFQVCGSSNESTLPRPIINEIAPFVIDNIEQNSGVGLEQCLLLAIKTSHCHMVSILLGAFENFDRCILTTPQTLIYEAMTKSCANCTEKLINFLTTKDYDNDSFLWHVLKTLREPIYFINPLDPKLEVGRYNELDYKLFIKLLYNNVDVEDVFLHWDKMLLPTFSYPTLVKRHLILCCGFNYTTSIPSLNKCSLVDMVMLHAVGVPMNKEAALSRIKHTKYNVNTLASAVVYSSAMEISGDSRDLTNDKIKEYITMALKHPRTLQNVCIVTIRRTISKNVFYNCTFLPVPPRMLEMIRMDYLQELPIMYEFPFIQRPPSLSFLQPYPRRRFRETNFRPSNAILPLTRGSILQER